MLHQTDPLSRQMPKEMLYKKKSNISTCSLTAVRLILKVLLRQSMMIEQATVWSGQ